jgi:hypothetical protein
MNTNDPDMDSRNAGHRPTLLRRIFSRENLIALALCLILIALVIATADSAPQWIYQGF